jgi:hypothetical protein
MNPMQQIYQVRNLEEEKKIKNQAEALVRVWFDLKNNPDPVAREILDFMAKLKVDARVVEQAYRLLAVELAKPPASKGEMEKGGKEKGAAH